MKHTLSIISVLAASVFFAGAAQASLRICNAGPARVDVAIMYRSPETCGEYGNFATEGWWSINPGLCAVVHGGNLAKINRYWYYYAAADDGGAWTGDSTAYVTNAAFSSCVRIGRSDARIVRFREIDVGNAANFTLNLVR
ncbi:DUF1036 domain-containing protein [Sorangium sp. So ce1128]